jgi:hypothetical protein
MIHLAPNTTHIIAGIAIADFCNNIGAIGDIQVDR